MRKLCVFICLMMAMTLSGSDKKKSLYDDPLILGGIAALSAAGAASSIIVTKLVTRAEFDKVFAQAKETFPIDDGIVIWQSVNTAGKFPACVVDYSCSKLNLSNFQLKLDLWK